MCFDVIRNCFIWCSDFPNIKLQPKSILFKHEKNPSLASPEFLLKISGKEGDMIRVRDNLMLAAFLLPVFLVVFFILDIL